MQDGPRGDSNSGASTRPASPNLAWTERAAGIAIDILAPLLWCYAIIKVFVFDVDIYIVGKLGPQFTWLIKYKLLFFLGLLVLILIRRKKSAVVISFLYITFYPLVAIGFLVYVVFRQRSWNLGIAFVNSLIVFFRSFKYNAILFSLYVIFSSFLAVSTITPVVWLSITVVLLLLLAVYVRSMIFVLRPSGAFEVYKGLSAWISQKVVVPTWSVDKEMRSLTVQQFNEAQLTKWKGNLHMAVLTNRAFLATAKRLREYQSSGLNIVSYVFTIFLLFLFTICSFALVNWGLYRVDHGEFSLAGSPSLFLFVYYSFNSLFYRSIAEVAPSRPIAQSCLMLEFVCAMFLIVILVTLFFTVKNQRYSRELEEAIAGIKQQGAAVEGMIKDEYRVDGIDGAIRELERLQVGVMSVIYSLSKYL
jgi:hypothetical protein